MLFLSTSSSSDKKGKILLYQTSQNLFSTILFSVTIAIAIEKKNTENRYYSFSFNGTSVHKLLKTYNICIIAKKKIGWQDFNNDLITWKWLYFYTIKTFIYSCILTMKKYVDSWCRLILTWLTGCFNVHYFNYGGTEFSPS